MTFKPNMTFDEIWNLVPHDFETYNSDVWTSIESLPFEDVLRLKDRWDDKSIIEGINDILQEKAKRIFEYEVINNLTARQTKMFRDYIALDRDLLWDTMRAWRLVND